MNSIIEDLESIVSNDYTVRLNYVDEKSEGISIIEDSVIPTDNELVRVGSILKSEVQFYIVSKSGKLYNKALSDMLDVYDNLYSKLYKEVGNKYILNLEDGQILNLGCDKGFDNVSMNVVITYKIIK